MMSFDEFYMPVENIELPGRVETASGSTIMSVDDLFGVCEELNGRTVFMCDNSSLKHFLHEHGVKRNEYKSRKSSDIQDLLRKLASPRPLLKTSPQTASGYNVVASLEMIKKMCAQTQVVQPEFRFSPKNK